MEFFSSHIETNRKPSEMLVLPFWEGKLHAEGAAPMSKYIASLQSSAIMQDFHGKEGELIIVYNKSNKLDKRYALLGLGNKEKICTEKLRRAYSQLVKVCHQKQLEEIILLTPQTHLPEEATITGIAEGLLLANYVFDKLKHIKKSKTYLVKKAEFIGLSKEGLLIAKRCSKIIEGVYIARDLVNDNADQITPAYLAHFAKDLSRKLPHIKTTLLNKKQIEKEKMGLLLAVNRGSEQDPVVIIMSYHGNPQSKEHTILIGKGISYDTGGLNLKPVGSMESMKADMAGAAAVIGTISVAASLSLKVNVTAVIPATENSIDSKSYKPGDVYKSASGHMIEITNPDAEGRLVLADAITYAKKKLKPTRLIDIATLTGGMDIALGSEACGLFSNNDDLANSILQAGSNTFERVWRLPLFEEYSDYLKSDIADMKNSGGRTAGPITAAMFLQEFVEKTPWAHLDIASVAYLNEKKRYHPKFATGFGVRLLVDMLSKNYSS